MTRVNELEDQLLRVTKERDELKAAEERDAAYLREVLAKVDQEQNGLAVCSWCALPTNSDDESKRKHQMTCPKSPVVRERDEARGKNAYMIEAFWLAIADLPHSDECDITTCSHQQPVCDHVNVDCTCPERACECECSCWRTAADKVPKAEECAHLCEMLRDAEEAVENVQIVLHCALPQIERVVSDHSAEYDVPDAVWRALTELKKFAGVE